MSELTLSLLLLAVALIFTVQIFFHFDLIHPDDDDNEGGSL